MMMLFIFLLLALVGTLMWFQGLWSNVVTFVNLWIASLLAFSLTEPITSMLDDSAESMGYVSDIVVMWVLFALIFGILRMTTQMCSKTRLGFPPLFETIGRSVMSVVNAYVFVMFACATLHAAPLQASPFGGSWPPNFIGLAPDEHFFAVVSNVSQGSLSGNAFDPRGYKADTASRRQRLEQEEGFLVK